MEHESSHFKGVTIVSRGEWQLKVPVDFHIVLDECADPYFLDQAAEFLAGVFVTDYVHKRDAEYEAATMEDDES